MSDFFSRDELLHGLSAPKAGMVYFAILNHTAYLVHESRQVAAGLNTGIKSAEISEQAFLGALAQGRDNTYKPSIQELERYAGGWAFLVPDNPSMKAGIANSLSKDYHFSATQLSTIRQVLTLDSTAVQESYQRSYSHPLESIYTDTVTLREQLKWGWSRWTQWLENLPPFWTAFSLTFTETFGASILALPIAMAGVGPIAGVILVILLGAVNLITMASMVEAINRNGNIRYGTSYFGQLVRDYLGQVGSVILISALLGLILLVFIAYYTGVSTTLAEATDISPLIWVGLQFLVGIYFLYHRNLNATIASSMAVAAINLSIIIILSLITLPNINIAYLRHMEVPFINGQPFNANILQLIFGVVLASYFGHTSPVNVAKKVLRREPSGRALLWGCVSATGTAMLFYAFWILIINGSIAPEILTNTSGTALIPLAQLGGPVVLILGSIYVVLGMGMTSIQLSMALFNQVQEWIPLPLSDSNNPAWRLWLSNQQVRFWLGIIPIAAIVAFIEWLLITGQESFAGTFSLLGVVTVPIIAGIIPILMLHASRQKGDYIPGVMLHVLGHPVVVTLVYLLFFSSILVHSLFIWQEPVLRVIGFVICVILIIATVNMFRQKTFMPRTVIEFRAYENRQIPGAFTFTSQGKPLPLDLKLTYKREQKAVHGANGELLDWSNLKSISLQIPPISTKELKLWLHKITPEDFSRPLAAKVSMQPMGAEQREWNIKSEGAIIIPYNGQPCEINIVFSG